MTSLPSSRQAGIPLLALDGMSKQFGNIIALDSVSLAIHAGQVHALLGENGAGKTTLMRIVFGLLTPDHGAMKWHGAPLNVRSPADALAIGIGMVHQHFTLVPSMTVAENVALGMHGRYSSVEATNRVLEACRKTGLVLDPDARVDSLSVSAQQRCEIVKALARNVQLLILDEPTAVLAPSESQDVLSWVRRFADSGNAVVLITHKLRDALSISDHVTVLRKGRVVLSTATSSADEELLARAMLGTDAGSTAVPVTAGEQVFPPAPAASEASAESAAAPTTADNTAQLHAASAEPVIVLDNVSLLADNGHFKLHNASMSVHGGEIAGIVGVEGSGHHELLRLLSGRIKPISGAVHCPDEVGFVPEDRHKDALMSLAPLYENTALHGAGKRRGRINWNVFRERTARILRDFDVRSGSIESEARMLSGGNQQKFVLGRELAAGPTAIVAENPSRGLDFKATEAIHESLRAAKARGTAVVVYGSDIDEVLELADRVIVVAEGRITEVLKPFNREQIGLLMLGATPQ